VNIEVGTSSLLALLLVSARIFAWSLVAPPLATGGLPVTVKTVVSVGLALVIVPAARAHVPAPDVAPVLGALVVQIVVGAGLGFLTRLLFTAVEAAGGLIDVFGGFSLSAAYDPLTTTMTSIFGRFYALLCTTLIFATDVHLIIFRGFLQTFTAIPLDSGISLSKLGHSLVGGMGELFVDALQIAGPLIVVLFIADIAIGVLNRIAPQLNAFSMSFPIKIGLTLMLVGLGFMLMPQTVVDLAGRATTLVQTVTG
jgi:flagellar biosynthesis protein FliR